MSDVPATQAELERSLGITPMDEIKAELERTRLEWARGAALYGPGGLLNDKRKALLSAIAIKLRLEHPKLSNQHIEEAAHADETYQAFLMQHELKRAKWLSLNDDRSVLLMRAKRGDSLTFVAGRGL